MFTLLEANQPRTVEDFLFKGMSEGNYDPEKALQDLNMAARLRNSAVVREQREDIESSIAEDTVDLDTLDLALADAAFAEAALPGDPNTLTTGLWTRMIAAEIYKKTRHPDKQKLMMDDAAKIAGELGAPRYKNSKQCHSSLIWYFDRSGNTAAIGPEVEELIRLNDGARDMNWRLVHSCAGAGARGRCHCK